MRKDLSSSETKSTNAIADLLSVAICVSIVIVLSRMGYEIADFGAAIASSIGFLFLSHLISDMFCLAERKNKENNKRGYKT